MGTVRAHTRIVKGKRQRVRRHKRRSVPAFAKGQLVKAWKSGKRKQAMPAVVYATAGVGTYATWGLFKFGTAALTTVGMAGMVACYGLHRRRQRNRGNLPPRPNRSQSRGINPRPRQYSSDLSSNWSRPPEFNPDGSITTFRKDGSQGRIVGRRPNR